jgi:hypothetical protein
MEEVVVLHLYLLELEQCPELILGTLIKTCNFVTFYKFLSHFCVHHTFLPKNQSCPLPRLRPPVDNPLTVKLPIYHAKQRCLLRVAFPVV